MAGSFTLPQILTEAEIQKAVKIFQTMPDHQIATEIRTQLIEPNLERISKALGQDMDAGYLSYAVYYVLTQAVEQ